MVSDPNQPWALKYDFVPVEGKPNCFVAVDKVTREPFSVPAALEAAYASGKLKK